MPRANLSTIGRLCGAGLTKRSTSWLGLVPPSSAMSETETFKFSRVRMPGEKYGWQHRQSVP
jgi:hypothetical protein